MRKKQPTSASRHQKYYSVFKDQTHKKTPLSFEAGFASLVAYQEKIVGRPRPLSDELSK